MAENIVQSLFGPTPYEVEQMRNKQASDYATKVANMNNIQQAKFGIGQGAADLTRSVGGMFGLVDPAVEQAKAREQALTNIDLSSSDAILRTAMQTQDPRLKVQLTLMAQQRKAAEQAQMIAAQKSMREDEMLKFKQKEEYELKKTESEARIRQNDERIADARTTAAERAALQRENNQIKLLLGQGMLALRQSAADSKVKPDLPTPALKLQQEELDAISTSSLINKNLQKYRSAIDDKSLDLGFVSNLASRGKNVLGMSDPKSQAFANFKADMEKMRNDSLRLNKGTQTEGDAIRAWNELFENINDPQVVRSRLETIEKNNEAATEFRMKNVQSIRKNFKADPFDFSEYVAPKGSAKTVVREVKLKDGRIGVEYSDGTRGFK